MKPLLHMLRQTRSSSEPWQPRHSPQPAPAGIFTRDKLWGRCEPPQPTCTPACWLLHRHEAARERQHRVAHFDGGTSVQQAVHAVVREAGGWSSGHRSQLKAVLVAGNLGRVQVYSRPLPRMLSEQIWSSMNLQITDHLHISEEVPQDGLHHHCQHVVPSCYECACLQTPELHPQCQGGPRAKLLSCRCTTCSAAAAIKVDMMLMIRDSPQYLSSSRPELSHMCMHPSKQGNLRAGMCTSSQTMTAGRQAYCRLCTRSQSVKHYVSQAAKSHDAHHRDWSDTKNGTYRQETQQALL